MTVNGLKMGLETQCCFQPVLPLSARWRRDAGTSAGAQTKRKTRNMRVFLLAEKEGFEL